MHARHSSPGLMKSVALSCLALLTVVSLAVPTNAKDRTGMESDPSSVAGDSLVHTEYYYALQRPQAANQLDTSFPGGKINYGDQGQTGEAAPRLFNPGTVWPEALPGMPTSADERTAATFNEIARVTGVNDPLFAKMPATALGVAMTQAAATQLAADYEADPQNAIARAKEEQNQANQTSADTNAQMERNQAGSAIDFTASYLYNFTVEANNKWNKVRNELFLPMALLLLLPGVVLAQLKATVSAGTPVISDVTSPFDGILRAIVGIFLIPGTYLFINYGIDVSNSITYTISSEYKRIFGTDMYKDAMCAHIRAFPYRNQSENRGYVPNEPADMSKPIGQGNSPFARFEGKNLENALRDPCAKLNQAPKDRSNEQVPHVVNAQRNAYNTANSALAMTWNILCAFQMAYLYYLWFVGPVIAALWVYPMKELRDAFPSWINGVCTICFWSLFWNTTILLMACCRGVDETGTLIMSALNFLSTACVKFAFDFAGLVKEAGMQAAKMAEKGGAAGAGGGKGAQGAAGKDGANAPPSYATRGMNELPGGPRGGGTETGSGTPGRTGDGRVTASASPLAFNLDSGTDSPTGGTRGLTATGGSDFNLAGFTHTPPPGTHGQHAAGLNAHLLNAVGSPLGPNFDGGGDGSLTGDGTTLDLDIDNGVDNLNLDTSNFAVGGNAFTFNGSTLNTGGVNMPGMPGGGDTNHHNLHLSQSEFQGAIHNNHAREQLMNFLQQQAQQAAATGQTPAGLTIDGANGAQANVSLAQLQQALGGYDQAVASGGVSGGGDVSIDQFLSGAGVDVGGVNAANFSQLALPPGAVASALNSPTGGGPNGDGPPLSFAKAGFDPSALGAGPVQGAVPPDMATVQAMSKIGDAQQKLQADIVAQQQQQVAQAQQQAQAYFQQGAGNTDTSNFTGLGQGGWSGGNGNPNDPSNLGNIVGPNPNNAAMDGMLAQYRSAIPDVQTGGIGSVNTPGVDVSGITLASSSAVNIQGQASGITTGGAGDPTLPANLNGGAGNNFNLGGGAGNNQVAANQESASQYLSRNMNQDWKDYENKMIQASVDDQARARQSVEASLTYGNSLQGNVQGTVYNVADASNVTGATNTGGYVANTPASYAQQGADNSNMTAFNSGGADNGTANGVTQPMDPLAKESMDKLAQTFQGFVPEVQQGGTRSGVDVGGLGTNAGSITYDNSGSNSYAQNSALANYTNSTNLPTPQDQPLALNTGGGNPTPQPGNQGGNDNGGFFASGPKADPAGGGQTFDKSAYLSQQVGEQWKQYDQQVDAAIADQYKQQMNNAVESTYSRATGSMQDNMTGAPSSLPNVTSGPSPSPSGYVASNDVSNYSQLPTSTNSGGSSNYARESGGGDSGGSNNSLAYNVNNEEARRQIDQLAKAVDYTPEVTIGQSGTTGGGDANGVPMQGLQYFAQASYQPQQQIPQEFQQLPTNMQMAQQGQLPQGQLPQGAQPNLPQTAPLPMPLRTGNIASNKADALKSTRAKESYSGGAGNADSKKGNGNKLSNALGKAASNAKKGSVPVGAGSKQMKDPMGSVASGSTLRRLRQKRGWSQDEISAMRLLATGEEVMVDITGAPYIVSVKHVIEIVTVTHLGPDPYVAPEYVVEIVEEFGESDDPYVGRPLPPAHQQRRRFIELIEIIDGHKRIAEIIEDADDPYVAPKSGRAVQRVVEVVGETQEPVDSDSAARGVRRVRRVVEVIEEAEVDQAPDEQPSPDDATPVTRMKNLWTGTMSDTPMGTSAGPQPPTQQPITGAPVRSTSKKLLEGVRVLMVVAPERFRDEELAEPRRILQQNGASVVVASTKPGIAKGMLGAQVVAERTVDHTTSAGFSAIVVVGGTGAQDFLWNNASLHQLLKQFNSEKKIVSSICLGGAALAKAGVIEGRQATVLATAESVQAMRDGKAIYKPEHIVQDSNAITADGPEVSANFGETLVAALERELKGKR